MLKVLKVGEIYFDAMDVDIFEVVSIYRENEVRYVTVIVPWSIKEDGLFYIRRLSLPHMMNAVYNGRFKLLTKGMIPFFVFKYNLKETNAKRPSECLK